MGEADCPAVPLDLSNIRDSRRKIAWSKEDNESPAAERRSPNIDISVTSSEERSGSYYRSSPPNDKEVAS